MSSSSTPKPLYESTISADRFGDSFGGERMWGLQELPIDFGVSWAPATPGWLYLFSFIALVSAVLGYRHYQRWLALAYYRRAKLVLNTLKINKRGYSQLPFLLRQSALKIGGRSEVASLQGEAWVHWMNTRAEQPIFDLNDAKLLSALAYQANPTITSGDAASLIRKVEHWLKVAHA